MIKKLQKIGNSRGLLLEKPLLKLLDVDQTEKVEIVPSDEGLLIKKPSIKAAYERISERHKKSLDKLAHSGSLGFSG
jgi:antitoxin component of MazEF toxin-antitoxin module